MIKKIITIAVTTLLFANTLSANEGTKSAPTNGEYYEIKVPKSQFQKKPDEIHPDQYLSPNGLATEVIFRNKGGYSASVSIEYSVWMNGYILRRYTPEKWIWLNESTSYEIPEDAFDMVITAARHTFLPWNPIRTIVSQSMCVNNNQWTDYNQRLNIIQLDVWGTTIHPRWKFMQPSGTRQNGADPSIPCGEV